MFQPVGTGSRTACVSWALNDETPFPGVLPLGKRVRSLKLHSLLGVLGKESMFSPGGVVRLSAAFKLSGSSVDTPAV